MPDELVSEKVCNERHLKDDERFRRDKADIEDLKEKVTDCQSLLAELTKNDIKTTGILDTLTGMQKNFDERLTVIEKRPAKWWDWFIAALIGAAGAGVFEYISKSLQFLPK
jgi:hypothetical protein